MDVGPSVCGPAINLPAAAPDCRGSADGWMTGGWSYDELHDLDSGPCSSFSSAPPTGVSACSSLPLAQSYLE